MLSIIATAIERANKCMMDQNRELAVTNKRKKRALFATPSRKSYYMYGRAKKGASASKRGAFLVRSHFW